jgi:hypothetical protein
MAILPFSEFPVHEKDQVDVIEMFHQLMGHGDETAGVAETQPGMNPPRSVPELGSQWGVPGVQ